MPTKQTARTEERPAAGDPGRERKAAYEAHTLAQMLYNEMMMRHAWPVSPQRATTR